MNGEIELRQFRAVGGCLDRPLQFKARCLVARRFGRRFAIVGSGGGVFLLACGYDIGRAHDDRTGESGNGAQPRHAAIDDIARVAIEIAQRRLDAEQSVRVRRACREAKLLRAAPERIGGRDLVRPRQRLGARFAGDVLDGKLRLTLLGNLDPAAADADLVEHDILRGKGQRHAAPSHIAPIAGAVGLEVEAQDGADEGDLARFDRPGEKRADIQPGFERMSLEERPVEPAFLVGDLDIVEFELGRRQEDKVNLAADFHLAPEQIRRLGLEHRAVIVPVDEERRGKERAQDQNQ